MELPNDPMILLSYINTQLRDNYASLDDLCAGLDVSKEMILEKLAAVDYEYDREKNAFV
ncbi:MAG: DUF4250 domain-containing protein [Lachnospiraceae bacterium]|nr:DUF4250 domain-containing protein [Lachnospiraceae bacterium]MCD7841901.1 DUF4250 domain-containing protein [Lachnospiraceae bacterium]